MAGNIYLPSDVWKAGLKRKITNGSILVVEPRFGFGIFPVRFGDVEDEGIF